MSTDRTRRERATAGGSDQVSRPDPLEIRFDKVSKVFHRQKGRLTTALRVLDGVDLTVPAGKVVCLVGPSGCGKTTLLRLAGGLLEPSEGSVRIGETDVSGPPREVSIVFQDSGLFPWKSVEENVRLGISLREHRKITDEEAQRCSAQIATVGLAGFERFYPGQLSGGMQQRAGIARALARQPRVLLMDEPFGALDAQTRNVMQEELQSLWQEIGVTILFVTHDLDEAVYLADELVLMGRNPGRIKEVIKVDVPRPRRLGDPELARLRERLWESLREDLIGEGGLAS